VLARVACEDGATRAELLHDVGEILVHKPSAVEIKSLIQAELEALSRGGLIAELRGRSKVTPAGAALAIAELGRDATAASWKEMRDITLVARALDIDGEAATLKALARPDQLRAHVLAKAYGFKLRRGAGPSQVRSRLADVALERAFGNRIKSGLGSRSGLAAKTARLLAGQLLRRPRNVGTDSRLIAMLAAEQAGATGTDAEALRLAVLRKYCGDGLAVAREKPIAEAPQPPIAVATQPAAASRPDLPGFAREVQGAARTRAEGWPGSRKAFICHVWQSIADKHPGWGLSEVEFKAMLTEAHRTGHLMLASADLKGKHQMKEFQASAIAYRNMVWHFVRVED
jgi:hypothetical protein